MSPSLMLSLWSVAATTVLSRSGGSGIQYCELIWGDSDSSTPDMLNVDFSKPCPTNPGFYNVTEDDVKAVHGPGAYVAKWNGLRELVVDEDIRDVPQSSGLAPPVYYEYGTGIMADGGGFRMMSLLQLPKDSLAQGAAGFSPAPVTRHLTMVYHAGSTVYELIAPDCGAVYVMESFLIGRPGAWVVQGGAEELPTLVEDGKLRLPAGWRYRTRVLEEDLVLSGTDGTMELLMDNLSNMYSKMEEPIDRSALCFDDASGASGSLTRFDASGALTRIDFASSSTLLVLLAALLVATTH